MKLTETERDHLLTLLADAEAEGNYYGNKAQYWKRHERIKAKLLAAPASAPAAPREAPEELALAYVLGQLRHAYHNLIGPEIAWDREHRMRLADGLISPQIMRLEQLAESMASTSAPAAPREKDAK